MMKKHFHLMLRIHLLIDLALDLDFLKDIRHHANQMRQLAHQH